MKKKKKQKTKTEVIFQQEEWKIFTQLLSDTKLWSQNIRGTPSKINAKNLPLGISYSNTEKSKEILKIHKKVRT